MDKIKWYGARIKCFLVGHVWPDRWEDDKFYPSSSKQCEQCKLHHSRDWKNDGQESFNWAIGSNWPKAKLFRK